MLVPACLLVRSANLRSRGTFAFQYYTEANTIRRIMSGSQAPTCCADGPDVSQGCPCEALTDTYANAPELAATFCQRQKAILRPRSIAPANRSAVLK